MEKPIFDEEKFSKSEQNGLALLGQDDLVIFAPGVSTGGIAEMKMASGNNKRTVIGTTIDEVGAEHAREMIIKYGLDGQVQIKVEDVSKPLPYASNSFDFIYARLVLHYLSKQDLDSSLAELNRVLKPTKKIFVVVRSDKNDETTAPDSEYDSETGFTYVVYKNPKNGEKVKSKRYFHSEETITSHIKGAGFLISSISSYDEQLYIDFERKFISPKIDNLIEVIATKP